MDNNQHVQRVEKPDLAPFIAIISGLAVLGFIGYTLFTPEQVSFDVEPPGSTVFLNEKMVCKSTPCTIPINRIGPKQLIISKAQHFHYRLNFAPFDWDWSKALDEKISLKFMLDNEELEEGMAICRAERAREEDPDNADAKPCVRVPPIMPWRAYLSGHCHVRFDIDDEGKSQNIRLEGCSEEIFAGPTKAAVRLWKFLPKTVDGKPVEFKDVENKLTFRLTDDKGALIPHPPYYESNEDHVHVHAVDVVSKDTSEPNLDKE